MNSRRAHVVEVDASGLTWVKAWVSGDNGDACVEAAVSAEGFLIRTSRDRGGPRLRVTRRTWSGLISWVAVNV